MSITIHGAIDGQGRCEHWHSEVDVVANRCATCGMWWACSLCHTQASDHAFGPMPLDAPAAACGVCGLQMDYRAYRQAQQKHCCPGCGHGFNPGCALHTEIYFQL
ncbi:CHY zinc finger protein [Corynebacterium lizhenjunii]|uniref:CHY zinc finger protein n=1 Tax=Corynebacterium lizhenjunii TaxID=2709394 RepID=UPI0013EB0535|nr:CHY zinc finger protein [Corynebacterium lizhenjunii]